MPASKIRALTLGLDLITLYTRMSHPIKTYKLKVKEVARETTEAITIKFESPQEKITYKSGQFITLILLIEGKEVRRSYSISSSPYTDDTIAVCVKSVTNGLVSNYLNNTLKAGDVLEVIEPMGHFATEPLASGKRHVILIGAGSGITPLISIAKTVLAKEKESKVDLIYGNRSWETVIYRKELENMESAYQGRFNVVHTLTQPHANWVGYSGRLNQATVVNIVQKLAALTHKECEYYLCGPQGMTEEALKAIDLLGVPKEKTHKESFHAAVTATAPAPAATANGKSKVKVIDGKKVYEFEVAPKDTILETALKLGYNLPYSCQAGMCTACMGKCTSGKVHMENPDGLTDNEVKQGFVLTCIGQPASPEIVIEL